MLRLYLFFLFFFFEQKTAYEMRISDWSSDVCSSDLAVRRDMRIDPPGIAGDRPLAEAYLAVRHRGSGRSLGGAEQLSANGPDLARELPVVGRQGDGGRAVSHRVRSLLRTIA